MKGVEIVGRKAVGASGDNESITWSDISTAATLDQCPTSTFLSYHPSTPLPPTAFIMSHKAGDGKNLAYDEKLLDVAPQVTKGQRQVTMSRLGCLGFGSHRALLRRKDTMQTSSIPLPLLQPGPWAMATPRITQTSSQALLHIKSIWLLAGTIRWSLLPRSLSGRPLKVLLLWPS